MQPTLPQLSLDPLAKELKHLHSVNAARLQQLESRVESSVRQQQDWLMDKNALLDRNQQLCSTVEQQAIALQEQRGKEEAVIQQLHYYQRLLVTVDAEWREVVDARERRGCELQVELDEWKELTEAEGQKAEQLRSAVADEQQRSAQLQLTLNQRDAQIDDLKQQLVDLQRAVFQAAATADGSNSDIPCSPWQLRSEDLDCEEPAWTPAASDRPLGLFLSHAAASIPQHWLSPASLTCRDTFPPAPTSPSPSVPGSVYEEVVELHESVAALQRRLSAAAQHETEATQAMQRVAELESELQRLHHELSELQAVCGDEAEVSRRKAAMQREWSEELRRWRLKQEADVADRMRERERQREQQRTEESAQQLRQRQQLLTSAQENAALVQQLLTAWSACRQPGKAGALSAALSSELAVEAETYADSDERQLLSTTQEQLLSAVRSLRLLRSQLLEAEAKRIFDAAECRLQ